MPKLLMFVPCERVLIEQGSNSVSLISVFSELRLKVKEPLTPDASIPLRWNVIATWRKDNDERSKDFEQRVYLQGPSSEGPKIHVDLRTQFEMTKPNHRTVGTINGFPVAVAGIFDLVLELRVLDSEIWREMARYPMTLIHEGADHS